MASAVADAVLAAGGLDQDAAHGFGRGREEVAAVVPAVPVRRPDEAQVRLVNQGSGLKGVVGVLPGQSRGGELPQLGVEEREEVGGGRPVAGLDGGEDPRDVGHDGKHTSRWWEPRPQTGGDRKALPGRMPRTSGRTCRTAPTATARSATRRSISLPRDYHLLHPARRILPCARS